MMKPYMMIMMMFMIMIMNLLTTKTSIMCFNLVLYTTMMSLTLSMKMKLTPIPFIVFLTMVGGLMIMFLYLAATLWMKKEILTTKNKIMMASMVAIPMITPMKSINSMSSNNSINLFDYNFNKATMMLIILLTLMLIFTIEIHMKTNMPFRSKLKIWG